MNYFHYKNSRNVLLNCLGIIGILFGACGCTSTESTANRIQDAAGSLATQLAANLSSGQKLVVGLVPLTEKNVRNSGIVQALQESLKNKLFLTRRFAVIEDDNMRKVREELDIQEQGHQILREDTIHHMGQLLGANAIVVGTITEVDSDYMIDCRLVPITTGVIGSAGEAKISKMTAFSWHDMFPLNTGSPGSSPSSYNNTPSYNAPSYNYPTSYPHPQPQAPVYISPQHP